MQEFIHPFLAYFSFTAMIIFGVTSYIIYINNKLKVFIWYAIYCLFLAIYISFKIIPYYDNQFIYDSGLNWFIQIIFYSIYMRFGIYFINYHETHSRNVKIIFRIQTIILCVSIIAFILEWYDYISLINFFIYVFLPFTIITTIYVVQGVWNKIDSSYKYFLYGTLAYLVLAFLAFYLSMKPTKFTAFDPMILFYTAIIIESFIFSAGLGQKIKKMYLGKIAAEQELNKLLQIENKNKALQLDVSELNNTVLRNQMNSHFVFNVLNSIKLFMMENDSEKAILYLSKFAKFMRKVLDANFYEDVTLHEELKAIDLYLSIELMRFDYSFSYHIDVSPQVDLHQIRLPAFILQPFIENVLWHGFMKKEGNKHLFIQVTKDLNIIIEDNGIGRKAAKLFNNSLQKHKSHGLNIIQERLQFFNQKHHRNIWFEIIDLPKGTRIVIYFN